MHICTSRTRKNADQGVAGTFSTRIRAASGSNHDQDHQDTAAIYTVHKLFIYSKATFLISFAQEESIMTH
jgi:hypothetical protein